MERRVASIGLVLSYFMLLSASELFAEDEGGVHAVYCIKREDDAFYAGERQVEGGRSPGVDTAEVKFRGSKNDQIRAECSVMV